MPMFTRSPSISQDNTPATAGITQNNIATAEAPCRLIARTYSDTPSMALSITTPVTANAALAASCTSTGVLRTSARAGRNATAFCREVEARKSTSEQNRC